MIARWRLCPRTAAQLRRHSWIAPVWIAVPLGLLHALLGLAERGWPTALSMLDFWGGQALALGGSYAVLINGSLAIAKRLNWVVDGGDSPS